MAETTKIEWTEATWNPITGCSVISPGCQRCYAMKLAGSRLQHIPSRAGLTVQTKSGPVWNGNIRMNWEWLDKPTKWKRGRKIFVCAHGDLFHQGVSEEMLAAIFEVMAKTPRHTFQVLTKRSARLRGVMGGPKHHDLWPPNFGTGPCYPMFGSGCRLRTGSVLIGSMIFAGRGLPSGSCPSNRYSKTLVISISLGFIWQLSGESRVQVTDGWTLTGPDRSSGSANRKASHSL
jgi:hypothetical protein